MNKLIAGITLAAACGLAALSAPALADGKVDCRSGPRSGWQDVAKLQAKLLAEGWTIKKAKIARDCYEVYGKTPEGDNVESFHHPVTLQKILVLKRGRTLFRAPGY
jgi:hypothetical protein